MAVDCPWTPNSLKLKPLFSRSTGNPSPSHATIKDCSTPTTVNRLAVTTVIHPLASLNSEGCALDTPASLPPPTLTCLSDTDSQANKDVSQGNWSNQLVHVQEDTPGACSLAVSCFPAGLSCMQYCEYNCEFPPSSLHTD